MITMHCGKSCILVAVGLILLTHGLMAQTNEDDPCSNYCANNGTCTVKAETQTPTCQCGPNFSGNQCKTSLCGGKHLDCGEHGTCNEGECKCKEKPIIYGDECQFNKHCPPPRFHGAGCEIDLCDKLKCVNGTCDLNQDPKSNSVKVVKCICQEGFEGELCETIHDPCSNYCANNGTCTVKVKGDTPTCLCATNFSGKQCEKDSCAGIDCGIFGRCILGDCNCTSDQFKGALCQINTMCLPQRGGVYCEIDVCKGFNETLCKHNGSCVASDKDEPVCQCGEEFTGANCETPVSPTDGEEETTTAASNDVCKIDVDCQNGGTCKKSDDKTECECAPEFEGDKCEREIAKKPADVCKIDVDCQNGGTCKTSDDKIECECAEGFEGDKCEGAKKPAGESNSTPFMAYFLVFAVVCIVGYIGFHNRKKIIGLVVERGDKGKGSKSRTTRPNSKDYAQLEENVSDSLSKGSGKTYIF